MFSKQWPAPRGKDLRLSEWSPSTNFPRNTRRSTWKGRRVRPNPAGMIEEKPTRWDDPVNRKMTFTSAGLRLRAMAIAATVWQCGVHNTCTHPHDGNHPVVQVAYDNRTLAFALDTGATNTDLYPPFASAFPELIRSAIKTDSYKMEGVGGAKYMQAATL